MANLTFRGSARRKAFDPFDVPDETLKLQQETERTLSGMREVRTQNLQNRRDGLQAIKENSAKEKEQRRENQSIERDFAKAFHEAEMQHYATRIDDAATKIKEEKLKPDKPGLQDLIEFIPSAMEKLSDIENLRYDRMSSEGKVLLNQLGADPSIAVAYTKQLDTLRGNESALNEVIEKYFPNASDLQRAQLRGLRGYRLVGFRAAAGQDVIENNYAASWEQWKRNPNNVGPSGRTVAEMEGDPNLQVGTEIKGLRARHDAEFQKQYFMGDNPELVKRYFQPELDKLADTYNAKLNETLSTNREVKNFQDDKQDVKSYRALDREGTQWVKDYVHSGGDKGYKWRTLSNVVTEMISSGEMNGTELDKILSTEIEINGKLTTIGESKEELFKPARKALHERENQNRLTYIENKKNKNIQALQMYEQHRGEFGRDYNAEEWKRLEDWYTGQGFSRDDMETYASWVKASKNREPMQLEQAREYLDGKARNNELTMMHLHLVPESLWDDYSKKALDGPNQIVDKKGIMGQLEKSIIAVADKSAKSKFEVRAEADRVISLAKAKVDKLLEPALISQVGGDPTDIYQKLIDKEIELLNSNAQGTIYERAVDSAGNILYGPGAGFVSTHDPTSTLRGYQQAIIEKQDLTGVLTEHDKTQLVNYQNRVGRMPLFLNGMAAVDPNRTPFEIAEALVAAEIKGGTIEPRGHEGILRVIPPANRKLITDRGSTAKTWLAAGYDLEQEDALTTSFIPKDIYNFNPDNPYDVVTSSFAGNGLNIGTSVFGTDLSLVPLQTIIDAQSKGIISEVGAFKTTKNDLIRLIGTGMASPEDMFTPELQKLFYREKVYQDTSTMYANNDMFEPIPGVGQHFITTAKEQKGELDEDTAAAISTRLDLTKIPAAVYNEFIGRTVQPLKRITK